MNIFYIVDFFPDFYPIGEHSNFSPILTFGWQCMCKASSTWFELKREIERERETEREGPVLIVVRHATQAQRCAR